jgi:hypothetical protein
LGDFARQQATQAERGQDLKNRHVFQDRVIFPKAFNFQNSTDRNDEIERDNRLERIGQYQNNRIFKQPLSGAHVKVIARIMK